MRKHWIEHWKATCRQPNASRKAINRLQLQSKFTAWPNPFELGTNWFKFSTHNWWTVLSKQNRFSPFSRTIRIATTSKMPWTGGHHTVQRLSKRRGSIRILREGLLRVSWERYARHGRTDLRSSCKVSGSTPLALLPNYLIMSNSITFFFSSFSLLCLTFLRNGRTKKKFFSPFHSKEWSKANTLKRRPLTICWHLIQRWSKIGRSTLVNMHAKVRSILITQGDQQRRIINFWLVISDCRWLLIINEWPS